MTLDQVRCLALALPEAAEAPHFERTSFRVRERIFATVTPEAEFLHVFLGEQERELALAAEPDFLEPLRWGRQTQGVRVLLPAAKASVVGALLAQAWARKAPKRLLAFAGDHDVTTAPQTA